MSGVLRSLRNGTDFWTSWVPAGPFSAWLRHLADATGFAPEAIAVAAGVSTGVGRALVGTGRRSHRIRSLDARGLLSLDIENLQWQGSCLTDASLAHKAMTELGAWCPTVAELSGLLGISQHTARGIIDGHLLVCRREVLWHCIALAQQIMHTKGLPDPPDDLLAGYFDEPLAA